MSDIVVKCPSCSKEVKLSESLTADLFADERAKIAVEEKRKAQEALSSDLKQKAENLAELQLLLKNNQVKLTESQKVQAEAIRKQREFEDKERELELTIEKRVQATSSTLREKLAKETEERYQIKMAEKDQAMASLKRDLEEMKRKAEQGSQQLQGEVLELELENMLRLRFPIDSIEPVAKGQRGADVIQKVIAPSGQYCGSLLWESKRTKNWSDGWIAKLKDDQRAAKIDIAILVSQTLPKDIESFDLIEGVWITHPKTAMPLAMSLRNSLIELASLRLASEGQDTKIEIVYQYLTGPRFRQRVQAIVESFSVMKEDLDREKRAITTLWQKRETQIERVMNSTVGMYGDLQAIAGQSLQEIAGLSLERIDNVTAPDE